MTNNDLKVRIEELEAFLENETRRRKELEKQEQTRIKFQSTLAHELRTPLNSILGIAELLKFQIYDNDQERSTLTDLLYSQSEKFKKLVHDLLDLTKIQSGRVDFFLELLDPRTILLEILKENHQQGQANSIAIETSFSDGDHSCYFDPLRFRQIFEKLIRNSIKFNRMSGKVTIELSSDMIITEIRLRDSGDGISEENLKSLFSLEEMIEKIANRKKREFFGLPLAKIITEAQGGTLLVESQLGKGSCFSVRFPKSKVMDPTCYRSKDNLEGKDLILFDQD